MLNNYELLAKDCVHLVISSLLLFTFYTLHMRVSREQSSVGIPTGHGLNGRGSITGKTFCFTTEHPVQFWVPSSLLYNGYWGQRGRGVVLNTNLHLVPGTRMLELYFQFPIRLHGAVLNQLSTGTTFRFAYEKLRSYK
jgi:hypothetical protein